MFAMKNSDFILFISLLGTAFAAPNLDGRIVGGDEVDEGDIPYIVSIRIGNRHHCGGTILDNIYILTAAHCIDGWQNQTKYLSVQYGTVNIDPKGPNIAQIKSIIVHEQYDAESDGIVNDIAIIELSDELKFGPLVRPVELAESGEDPGEMTLTGLAGWGLPYTGGQPYTHLRSVLIQTYSNAYCFSLDNRFDPKVHMCGGRLTGGAGQCTGDSGGPVMIDGRQFGVISWSEKPCAIPENPGIFTRIPTFRKWIYEKTGV